MVDMLSQARSIDPPIKQQEPEASVVRTILPITLARLIYLLFEFFAALDDLPRTLRASPAVC
jgi:hypothetical protein